MSLAVEGADQVNPIGLAQPLLALLSLLDPNGIPPQVITAQPVVDYLASQTGTAVDAEQAHDALGCLTRVNLAGSAAGTQSSGSGRVRVHALVQRAARDQTKPSPIAAAAPQQRTPWSMYGRTSNVTLGSPRRYGPTPRP